MVDCMAKQATTRSPPQIAAEYPPTELKKKISQKMHLEWAAQYASIPGNRNTNLFPVLKRNPWFYKVRQAKPESFYRNITRLRTNSRIHLFDPLTLPDCPHCPEDAETMAHIILECPQYEADRNDLLSSIPRDVTSPFNLDTLIAEEKLEVYECIDDFLNKIERSL
ncbi:hypothetical protein GE061_019280 [Apolygus lucorum]|uniref:Reverse transcriptase zinc-binding domain-containing protein n=1 Tax=Apolygus lucorum TaxID=248454 RepID=A0A8S9X821_APOLU|nr:hypothetical protein GE061_019280 [Apolygus lucorum]